MARPRSTTTEAVMNTAAQLFLDRGFQSTSIEDIAIAAGITKPTVYSYVESKQWLLDQIILRVINDLSVILEPWEPGTVKPLTDQLDEYLDFHIDRVTRLRVFYRILYSEETEMSPAVRERWHSFATEVTEHFVALLELYREEGRFNADADPHVIANLFIPSLVSLHRWYKTDGTITPERLRELAKQLLIGIIDL